MTEGRYRGERAGRPHAPQVDRPAVRPPRWGVRALWFLALAVLALVVAGAQGRHTVGTLGSLAIGLIGAARCSALGVRAFRAVDAGRPR